MQNEMFPVRIKALPEFERVIKRWEKKRYRSIRKDVREFVESIKTADFPGDPIRGFEGQVYKARVKNSDIQKGKSGGYRVIYYYHENPETIVLLTIFSKSDQPDISPQRIVALIESYERERE